MQFPALWASKRVPFKLFFKLTCQQVFLDKSLSSQTAHNAPYLPPKICITIVFDLIWEWLHKILGGKQGASWSMWEWWITLLNIFGKSTGWKKSVRLEFLPPPLSAPGSPRPVVKSRLLPPLPPFCSLVLLLYPIPLLPGVLSVCFTNAREKSSWPKNLAV